MVHQHFMLVPVFTVAENVMLGVEPTGRLGRIDRGEARRRVAELSDRYGLAVDPDATVEDLAVGVQQRVEILKALYRDAQCLILDEPTAVLTLPEIAELMDIVRQLADGGRSIIFITHKLRRLASVADRITVLRGGRVVGETTLAEAGEQALATMMVGHEVQLVVEGEPASSGEPVLEVTDLVVADDRRQPVVNGVSFDVRAGDPGPGRRAGQRPERARRSHLRHAQPRIAPCGSRARTWAGPAPPTCSGRAWRTSPRTASATGSSARCRCRPTWSSTR